MSYPRVQRTSGGADCPWKSSYRPGQREVQEHAAQQLRDDRRHDHGWRSLMAQKLGFPTKCLLSRMHNLFRDYTVHLLCHIHSFISSAENKILKGNAAYLEGL